MQLITTSDELADVIAAVATVDRYALDTEFHRERTYFPQVALIQIGWFEGATHRIALIDPLAVDVAPLAGQPEVLVGDVDVLAMSPAMLEFLDDAVQGVACRVARGGDVGGAAAGRSRSGAAAALGGGPCAPALICRD